MFKVFYSFLFLCCALVSKADEATFTPGWTGVIKVKLDHVVNLAQHPISFTVAPGTVIGSVWGLDGPVEVVQEGSRVTLKVNHNWNEKPLEAQNFQVSFSPNHELKAGSVSDLKIGATSVPLSGAAAAAPAPSPVPVAVAPAAQAGAAGKAHAPVVHNPVHKGPAVFNPHPPAFSPYIDITLNTVTHWSSALQSMAPEGLPKIIKDSGVKSVRLAFITEQGGTLSWAGNALNYAESVVQGLQVEGIDITVSLGGVQGTFPGEHDHTVDEVYQKLKSVADAYPGARFCFDIESPALCPLAPTANSAPVLRRIMQAFAKLQKEMHIPLILTLPVLPDGLTGGGEDVVRAAIESHLDFKVNVMAMDYGPSFVQKSMALYAEDAANNTAAFLEKVMHISHADALKKVELTPMIGHNDTRPLNFTLADAEALHTWAHKHGVTLSMWSLTRDHASSLDHVSYDHSGKGHQQKSYEFSHVLGR